MMYDGADAGGLDPLCLRSVCCVCFRALDTSRSAHELAIF